MEPNELMKEDLILACCMDLVAKNEGDPARVKDIIERLSNLLSDAKVPLYVSIVALTAMLEGAKQMTTVAVLSESKNVN